MGPGLQNCIFCGTSLTEEAKTITFPQTFTAYQLIQAGDKACPQCATMFTDPKYRRNSWIFREGKFEAVKDPTAFLLNLPEPPFLLYLTKTKRKHGWIRAAQNPTLSTKRFILVVDEEKIMFDTQVYAELYAFCRNLFARRIPKAVMLGGMPKPSDHRKYGLNWKESFKLRELQYNPLWRVVVEFRRRD
jgi:CRISPR type IV-associated protein Csf1